MADIITASIPQEIEGEKMEMTEQTSEGEVENQGDREENEILAWNPEITEEMEYGERSPEETSNEEPCTTEDPPRMRGTQSPERGAVTTRAGRVIKQPKKYDDYVVYEACQEQKELMEPMVEYKSPIGMMASSDPDTMYYHEILRQPDKKQFFEAMEKEITDHNRKKHWRLVRRSKVPQGKRVLPSVWAMRRKRDLRTGEIIKWKSRLNVDGSKQIQGQDYEQTYSPVAMWPTVRIVVIIPVLRGWKIKQLDFVQAYPQAVVEQDLYIEIPKGCMVNGVNDAEWVLQVLMNIYGQKQAGKVWNDFLMHGLTTKLGFTQSKMDPCVLWRGGVIIVIYTDDTIITGAHEIEIDEAIMSIASIIDITSSEYVSDLLGVNIEQREDGKIALTQPKLIETIIKELGLKEDSNTLTTPGNLTVILQKCALSKNHNETWNYRAMIGKLNYLAQSTRPDIAYAVHQCARFSKDPKQEHSKAVKRIGRYLAGTKNDGLLWELNDTGLECFSDADFIGNWDKVDAETEVATARSRSGYVINYAGCPILWASKLQTEIALSSTES
jgi:Reverse transcriptase (RNA-dependent DNA polymerase)